MFKFFSKAKKLKIGDKSISLGLGFMAKPNKDGTISIFLKKKIKGNYSPITLLLGKFPFDKEKKVYDKGLKYARLCSRGIHPNKPKQVDKVFTRKKKNIIIFGTSGHSKVIIDIIKSSGNYNFLGFISNRINENNKIEPYPILGNDKTFLETIDRFKLHGGIIGVGDNFIRYHIATKIKKMDLDFNFINCIHASAIIGSNVEIGSGNVIMPGVSINASTIIKDHCILNTNSSIDHDSLMENFSSIAPNSATGGNVKIGKFSSIGIGSCINHSTSIAENCIIGAGSVVTKSTKKNSLYFGNPAKFIRKHKLGERYL